MSTPGMKIDLQLKRRSSRILDRLPKRVQNFLPTWLSRGHPVDVLPADEDAGTISIRFLKSVCNNFIAQISHSATRGLHVSQYRKPSCLLRDILCSSIRRLLPEGYVISDSTHRVVCLQLCHAERNCDSRLGYVSQPGNDRISYFCQSKTGTS